MSASSPRLPNIDYEAFADEIFALKKRVMERLGEADIRHLKKMIWVNRLCTFLGYATAWIIPNPISAYLISQGIFGRWMIMHHVSHEGYDKVPGVPARYTSPVFAQGLRRYVDWFDWIWPEAWHYEHDMLHHFYSGEERDPDLVEDHAVFLREVRWPRFLKYIFVVVFAITWKFGYYAPNTLRALAEKGRNPPSAGILGMIWRNGLNPFSERVRRLWLLCFVPYIAVAFVIIPLCFLPLGKWAVLCVLANRLLAELMTNAHSFLVVGPNHSGDDLYRFDQHFKGRAEFCVNQVITSCNYHTGSELVDYVHVWLNYQIEHHLFPKLPMLQYRLVQPEVKAICEKYGVPYVQQSVFRRFAQLVGVMIGAKDMRRLEDAATEMRPDPA